MKTVIDRTTVHYNKTHKQNKEKTNLVQLALSKNKIYESHVMNSQEILIELTPSAMMAPAFATAFGFNGSPLMRLLSIRRSVPEFLEDEDV